MHYHNSRWMQLGNAVTEFFLIIAAYILAGLCRAFVPIGTEFLLADVWYFFPLSVIYAVMMVACYTVRGNYNSIHVRGKVKELAGLAAVDLLGFALTATLLYVFQLSQFSRLLLGYFYLLSVLVIFIKRCICDRIAKWYAKKHHICENVLLIGSGELALRFYRGVIPIEEYAMNYVGYLADKETQNLPEYLGDLDALHDVLESRSVSMIVIAQEEQSSVWMKRIVAMAAGYRIRVCVVPVYSDYVSAGSGISYLGGLRMIDLSLLDACNIMGVNIGVTDMNKTLTLIESRLQDWRGKYICVANVHTTVTAYEDADYKKVQNNAVIALPDGGPLSAFSREHGYADAARVTGPDLMREVLKISAEKGWRHYFYGSTEKTLAELRQKVEERYPGAIIAGMYSPPFRAVTPQEDAEIVKNINETKPDFVWVGLGAPKQERWMAAHEDRVQALMIGVGAAFDYEAGNIRRAPQWMQKRNLEWLYRLMQDPKRLFKRYMSTNLKYLLWKWRQ